MPGTTPILGAPYAVDTDARAAGAGAIQDLAEWAETELLERDAAHAARWASGVFTGAPSAMADNTLLTCGYDLIDASAGDFSHAGGVFTYTGPAARWFLGSFGVYLTANDALPASRMQVVFNGGALRTSRQSGLSAYTHHLALAMLLTPGDTIAMQALVNSSSAPGSQSENFLTLAAV